MGSATVGAKFAQTGKQYDLVVGTYQLCIIMLFNSEKELMFKDIKQMMKFDDETCAKNLKSMMIGKYQLLSVKAEKSGQITDEDLFFVNEQFSSQLKKIQFPTPVLEEVYKKCKSLGSLTLRNRRRRQVHRDRGCDCKDHEIQEET